MLVHAPVVPSVRFSTGWIKDVHDRRSGLDPGKTDRLRLRYELLAGPGEAGGQFQVLLRQEAAEFVETREQFRAAVKRRQRLVKPGANACGAVPRAVIQDVPESRRVDKRLGLLNLRLPFAIVGELEPTALDRLDAADKVKLRLHPRVGARGASRRNDPRRKTPRRRAPDRWHRCGDGRRR